MLPCILITRMLSNACSASGAVKQRRGNASAFGGVQMAKTQKNKATSGHLGLLKVSNDIGYASPPMRRIASITTS